MPALHPVAFARQGAFRGAATPDRTDQGSYTVSIFRRPALPALRHASHARQHPAAATPPHQQQQQQQQQQQEQPIIALPVDRVTGWSWQGQDEFSALGDRQDRPPLLLPLLGRAKRVVLVRHGQSTWNARNRIQGSSNFSVLTDQGLKQAAAAGKLVRWHSGRA
jgi:hypothetical protein